MVRTCIIVASHITKSIRVKYLCESLDSLLGQTMVIPIFLSISFEDNLVFEIFKKQLGRKNLLDNAGITIFYREKQTSQFRHIFQVFESVKYDFDYIMFCDDDDTYDDCRVEMFMASIDYTLEEIKSHNSDKIFVGAYETKDGISHSKKYTEYWNYCISSTFIQKLETIIKEGNFDRHIDNNYFDMMFGSYLRFLNNKHLFTLINLKMYNYNKYDSSILGIIKENNTLHKQITYRNINNPIESLSICNDYIRLHLDGLKQNMFLKISYGHNYDECNVIKECFPEEEDRFISLLDRRLIQDLRCYYLDAKKLAVSLGIHYN